MPVTTLSAPSSEAVVVPVAHPGADRMTADFLRAVRIAVFGSTLLPLITTLCSAWLLPSPEHQVRMRELLLHVLMIAVLNVAVTLALARAAAVFDQWSRAQAEFLDALPVRRLDLAIVAAAALSLFLELAVIRWQGSVFELFALYKNLGLLACFAGLGLGYALAGRERLPLFATLPLLAWQMLLLTDLRHGLPGAPIETNGYSWRVQSLLATPFPEQRNIGFATAQSAAQFIAAYAFLSVLFVLSALAFLPVGQLCGRLMARREQLRAYALNLVGSLAGVVLLLVVSALWTPPLVWFALLFALLLAFQAFDRQVILAGAGAALAAAVVLAWPVSFQWERIYSPYQVIEHGPGERGLTVIRAAGHYYQKVHDLSAQAQAGSEERHRIGFYYELPYRVHGTPGRVAILGAGTGNDVAAALRAGAEHVDAIEIDPVILRLGRLYHPERPYDDPRVRGIVNDARTYLRTTPETYDLIVYGLLDSHTLLSHASSVRLESFVYTVEGIREARARLKEDGLLSLSFAVVSKEIGRKIYMMMTEAFDGRPPLCLRGAYDGSVIFLQRKNGGVTVPARLSLDRRQGFWVMERFEDAGVRADVSTDDWPFLYMAARVYPRSYLFMGLVVIALTALLTGNFMRERPAFSHAVFFFLGAGFMLVETKAITELGLTFGNTWHVIGISIAGILAMAFLATVAVSRWRLRGVVLPFVLLLASLGLGWYVSRAGGFAPTPTGKLAAVALLSLPIFFSGILFARFLDTGVSIGGVMAVNLLGAMVGGLLEYNSMYFGFRFLYGLAAALYACAFLLAWRAPARLGAQ
jgi:spermine/spermidine synthase